MMYRQPNITLRIEYAAEVTPCHRKVWLSFNRFQVTSLQNAQGEGHRAKQRPVISSHAAVIGGDGAFGCSESGSQTLVHSEH